LIHPRWLFAQKKPENFTPSKNSSQLLNYIKPISIAANAMLVFGDFPTSVWSFLTQTNLPTSTKAMSHHFHANPTRREALYGLGAGLGSVAFASLLQGAGAKTIHHPAKAKRCIFLMMEGGPSHIDTFDPKPELTKSKDDPPSSQGKALYLSHDGRRSFTHRHF
jgi:hypothetical protein